MRNILENKFWWAARSFVAIVFFSVSTLSANVFITEIADPNNAASTGRFIELYNSGSTDIDLSADGGWALQRWIPWSFGHHPKDWTYIDILPTIVKESAL